MISRYIFTHGVSLCMLVSSVVIQFPVFQASNAVKTNNSVPVAQGIKFSICYFTQRCMSLYRPILGERRHIIMDAAHVWLQWRSTRERLHYVFRCRINHVIFQHVYNDTKLQLKIMLPANLSLCTPNHSLPNHYAIHCYKYKLLHILYTILCVLLDF